MKTIPVEDVTVVILAGGQGSRMGGQDKGLVEYRGKPMIDGVIDQVKPQTNRIMINANRNLETYRSLGYPLVPDSFDGFQGPLAGFLAAIQVVTTPYILTLPCDAPIVAPDYLSRMIHALESSGNPLAVAADTDRLQPVYALISCGLKSSLLSFLDRGDRKIDRWYQQHEYSVVDFEPQCGMFTNFNRPEDMERFSLNSAEIT